MPWPSPCMPDFEYENKTMQKIKLTDVILRDAHQSLIATRMRTEDMLPICPQLDAIGYWSLECWGGATYDACLRFLKEDPWERLQKLREASAIHQPKAWWRPCAVRSTTPD